MGNKPASFEMHRMTNLNQICVTLFINGQNSENSKDTRKSDI